MNDNAVRFGYQCPLYPWETIVELASYCDKSGFHAVTMADHTVGMGIKRIEALEAWTTLASMAVHTERVRLGSVVSDVHRHHPAVLAQMVATVDHISKGRVFLGVGAGEAMNLEPYGISWSRAVSRTLEALRVVKLLWTHTGGRVDYQGEFYGLRNAGPMQPLQKPHPPIWIAANSPRMLKSVGELADGWIPMVPMSPGMYAERLKFIRNVADQHGRDRDAITPALFTYFVVSQDRDTAGSLIELPAKMYALMSPSALRQLGFEVPDTYSLQHLSFSDAAAVGKLMEDAKKLPFEVIENTGYIFGTPEDCIQKIEDYIHAGVRFFIMPALVTLKLMKPTLTLFAERVLPYFTQREQ